MPIPGFCDELSFKVANLIFSAGKGKDKVIDCLELIVNFFFRSVALGNDTILIEARGLTGFV